MSIFSGIAKAEHTFVAWAEKELAAFEKKAPAIEAVVDAGIKYIAPVLQIALTAIGEPAAAAAVAPIVAEVQKDLTAVSAVIYDFGPTPTAASMFASIETNLQSLLAAGHITSTMATSAVNKVIGEVSALGAAVAAAASALTQAKPITT